MSKASLSLMIIGCFLWLCACNDDDDDTSSSGGASGMDLTGGESDSSGVGGNSGKGGLDETSGVSGMNISGGIGGTAASGGTNVAGIGGTAGTEIESYNKADHCSPGEYVEQYSIQRSMSTDGGTRCFDEDYYAAGEAGVFSGEHFSPLKITSIELAVAMQTGMPYALSFEIQVDSVRDPQIFQVWGTHAKCGAGDQAELLFELMLQEGKQVVCTDVTPNEDYTYLIVVVRDEDDTLTQKTVLRFGGATYCPTGRCP